MVGTRVACSARTPRGNADAIPPRTPRNRRRRMSALCSREPHPTGLIEVHGRPKASAHVAFWGARRPLRVKMRRTQREQIGSVPPHLADLNETCPHFADGPILLQKSVGIDALSRG